MDAWHNGTRKQNVEACSDAKLKVNYDICKQKGYDKEAELLKKEADARGLTLESLKTNAPFDTRSNTFAIFSSSL